MPRGHNGAAQADAEGCEGETICGDGDTRGSDQQTYGKALMWTYEQATGRMLQDGERIAIGYSGAGDGKNNPAMQDVQNVGPLPKGNYSIGSPVDTVTHGPYVLPLTPDPANEMFGRSGFLIHGDSVVHPGTASEGCIILGRMIREKIWDSDDHQLEVT